VSADELICGDEGTVYANEAYDNKARRERLKRLGIRDGIARRGNRWHQMRRWMVRRSRVRAPVEPLFALLKNTYRFTRARHRGLARNAAAFYLVLAAMNLKRWAVLHPA
jgi:IS5 family transposase